MDKYSLPVCTEVFSSAVEKSTVFEAILPDYCPGIRKIIKADAVAKMPKAEYSSGVINTECTCIVKVLYMSENSSMKSVAFNHEFECSFDASKTDSSLSTPEIFVKVSIPKVYAKPKSARSAEIKLDAAVSVAAYYSEEIPLFSNDASQDAETSRTTAIVTGRYILAEGGHELSDTINLDETMPAASEITDSSLMLSVIDKSFADGFIKYKGNAVFKCTYKSSYADENGENQYIYCKKDIPFEGEITSEKITSDSKALLDITPNALDVNLSADPYGENRIISISGDYAVHAEIFNDKEAEFTRDGFCPSYECSFESSVYNYEKLCDCFDICKELTEVIPLDGVRLAGITDTELKTGNYYTELHDGTVRLCAKANAIITGSDDSGEPVCIEHRFTIKQDIDDSLAESDKKYIVCCNAAAKDAVIKDGELSFDYIFNASTAILDRISTKAINGVDIFYDKPKPVCRSEYIIYYPDKSETLWDIAKKYEIPQKKLCDANGIEDSKTLNKKTVLIPCAL